MDLEPEKDGLQQKMSRLLKDHDVPPWFQDDDPINNEDRFYLSGYAHGLLDDAWRPNRNEVSEKIMQVWQQGFEDGKGDREESKGRFAAA